MYHTHTHIHTHTHTHIHTHTRIFGLAHLVRELGMYLQLCDTHTHTQTRRGGSHAPGLACMLSCSRTQGYSMHTALRDCVVHPVQMTRALYCRYFASWKQPGVVEDHILPPYVSSATCDCSQVSAPFGDGVLRLRDTTLAGRCVCVSGCEC